MSADKGTIQSADRSSSELISVSADGAIHLQTQVSHGVCRSDGWLKTWRSSDLQIREVVSADCDDCFRLAAV